MPANPDTYQARIDAATHQVRKLANETLEHLLSLPDLDGPDALDSLTLIEVNAREMRFYVERIGVLARLRDSNAR